MIFKAMKYLTTSQHILLFKPITENDATNSDIADSGLKQTNVLHNNSHSNYKKNIFLP